MDRTRSFLQRQTILVGLGLAAYLTVRFVTEGDVINARENARRILELEARIGLDIERGVQSMLIGHDGVVTVANWIYIWGYWPVVAATLVWLAFRNRPAYLELRNAMFISGAIGLVIFATFAVTPPRLFASYYVDTVTDYSVFYRVVQPPSLANEYAALPSFHFGWNLLIGIAWFRIARRPIVRYAAMAMPAAMAFAVVVTANHWILDVLAGGLVAMAGLAVERGRPRQLPARWESALAASWVGRALFPVKQRELVLDLELIDEYYFRRRAAARAATHHGLGPPPPLW